MLSKNELEGYRTFGDPYQVEKDYLQELSLYEIYSKKYTTDSFVFKGGTALSKFYHSSRFSEDLDFTATAVDVDAVSKGIEQIGASLFYKTVLTEKPSLNKFGTLHADMAIEGPRYNGKASTLQHIRFEVNTVSRLEYKPVPMTHNPIYSDLAEYTALIMDRREIMSEKVRAIMSVGRRHKERDLYDMYFLIGKGVAADKEVVIKKLEQSNITLSRRLLMDSIEKIKATWKQLEPFVVQELPAYTETRSRVIESLKNSGLL